MDYSEQTKDHLLAEVSKRKQGGRNLEVNQQDNKADIVSALELDDEAKDNASAANSAQGIPQVEAKEPSVPVGESTADLKYSGVWTNNEDGEPYGLCVVQDAPDGRTHFAKNSVHFWNGSATDFKLKFDKA